MSPRDASRPVSTRPAASPLVVSGWGAAGAAMALALHREGVPAEALAVYAGPSGSAPATGPDARFLALNAGSRRLLERLGVWSVLAADAHPMRSIRLTDTSLGEPVRPILLGFDAEVEGEPLAHLVGLPALTEALRAAAVAAGIAVHPVSVAGHRAETDAVSLDLSDGTRVAARLLIAADGAGSPVRQQAGIPLHGWAYGQRAIVATLRHSGRHEGEAVQHFLPSGPFALLPLDEFRSSIVWSEREAVASDLLAGPLHRLHRAIEERAAGHRGTIEAVEAVSSHPLRLGLARRFVAERLALVADAAHVVHPLAGQGLNLGFADVETLARLIGERLRLGLDPGAPDLLETYQAIRRPPTLAMAAATEGINRLFSNDWGPLRVARDFGLGLVERSPWLKARFRDLAAGMRSGA